MEDITKKKHMSFKEIAAYSLGLFGFQAIVGLLNSYQAEFDGSILGANVSVVAILILVAKIVSAVADPVVGNLVDRSKSKLGKFKSMIIYSIAPLLIFTAVVFDPGHLSLVKGAPEGRRKFLDAALCQLYPGYLTLYRRYVRALQQKNALLRRSSNGIERPYAEKRALLEVLNVELAQQGEAIQQRRRAYLAAMRQQFF